MNNTITIIIPLLGVCGLIYTYIKSRWITKLDPGTPKMQQIATSIADGAMAFYAQNIEYCSGLSWRYRY